MKTFFHISKTDLRIGLNLPPGQWGHETEIMPFMPIANSVIKDLIFEEERVKIVASDGVEIVSRLNCFYASPDLNSARDFRNKIFPGRKIYEILVDDATPIFEGDSELYTNCFTVEQARRNAVTYWNKGVSLNPIKEVLIGGPVTVTRFVE